MGQRGATGKNRTCDAAFGGPHDIHFTTVARQPGILSSKLPMLGVIAHNEAGSTL
jgi:hypothetical protein